MDIKFPLIHLPIGQHHTSPPSLQWNLVSRFLQHALGTTVVGFVANLFGGSFVPGRDQSPLHGLNHPLCGHCIILCTKSMMTGDDYWSKKHMLQSLANMQLKHHSLNAHNLQSQIDTCINIQFFFFWGGGRGLTKRHFYHLVLSLFLKYDINTNRQFQCGAKLSIYFLKIFINILSGHLSDLRVGPWSHIVTGVIFLTPGWVPPLRLLSAPTVTAVAT